MLSRIKFAALLVVSGLASSAFAGPLIYSERINATTGNSELVTFDASTPGSVSMIGISIGTGSATFISGLDFSADGRLWGVSRGTTQVLCHINKNTGVATNIGTGAGLVAGDQPNDLSWNPVDLRMYMLAGPGASSLTQRIYTVDLATGAFTLVATLNAPAGVVCTGLAIDGSGGMYLQDVLTDRMYQVVGTNMVGMAAHGFDANFTQGMSFDHKAGGWWFAAYNLTLGRAQLYRVAPATGACTLVGLIGTAATTTFNDVAIERPNFQCPADFNHDGVVDFFDYLDFVDAFSVGCP